MSQDTFGHSFPVRISYNERELASRDKIQAFQLMANSAFQAIERAIGDLYNTENATNSVLATSPLFMTSLGRAIGSMADLIPVLDGLQETSPKLATRLAEMSYNVIPHPNQPNKLEVGCKYDTALDPDVETRSCSRNQNTFYGQVKGTQTGICQNTSCPQWSGRAGRQFNSASSNQSAQTFREYKLVVPTEQRLVSKSKVVYFSNCGATYDKYRVDEGVTGYRSESAAIVQTWAQATGSDQIRYEYRNLDSNAKYNVVIELPALDTDQTVVINGVSQRRISGTSRESSRWIFSLENVASISSIVVVVSPATISSIAAVSKIWIIQTSNVKHHNYGQLLKLPRVLDNLNPGTEIPPNFLQVFDTNSNVNRVFNNIRYFVGSFNPGVKREAFDILLAGDQQLAIGHDRYLAVTVGAPVAPVLGALLEAFVEHVNDKTIHMDRANICALLANRSSCCGDRLKVELDHADPSNRFGGSAPAIYSIFAKIYGGFPPYTVTIDWGDSSNRLAGSGIPAVTSGVQVFTFTNNLLTATEFSHEYWTGGNFDVRFSVSDDPDRFGCGAVLEGISPFRVGNPPVVDPEVRLDYVTNYPYLIFRDMFANYNFTITAIPVVGDPFRHVLTQVHNTDIEDGKPTQFGWTLDNPSNLYFRFEYENVSGVQGESVTFNGGGTASLTNDLIQQDSLVLTKAGRVYQQGIDYTVNWATGVITIVGSSIAPGDSGFSARYFHYYLAANSGAVPNQWVAIAGTYSGKTIDLSSLLPRQDLNTIRFVIYQENPDLAGI